MITAQRGPGTVGKRVICDECGASHVATYSHEGRFGEGPIYAVICTDASNPEWLTDYYTEWAVQA